MIGFNPTPKQAIYLNRRLAESHKTMTELMHQIVDAYVDFEKAGYLGEDGNKIKDLETKIQLTEKLRQVEANRLQDKLDFEREMQKLKTEHEKERARDRALRHQPRVDWGESKGTYVEGASDSFALGDR